VNKQNTSIVHLISLDFMKTHNDIMTISTIQVLEFLSKAQKLGLNPEITIFDGDFIIHYDDVYGRDMTESIIITKKSVWMGYGWRFEEFINVLDEKIGVKND